MVDRYDVVVVGGGLAGLCAAAYASHAGFSVLVCEQSDKPGGYFRGFSKDGFYFDTGLKAVENAGMLIPMLRQLGLEKRLMLRWSKCCFAFPDKVIPLDREQSIRDFYGNLAEHFPESRSGLEALLKESDRVSAWVNLLVTLPNPLFEPLGEVVRRLPLWISRSVPDLLRSRNTAKLMDITLTDHIRRYVSNPALIRILTEFFFSGTPALFGLGYSKIYMDYHYAFGGMQRITDLLAEDIVEHGGAIRTSCEVSKIDVDRGQVKGVRTQDGNTIAARFVVAACDMRRVFLEMMDSGDVDPAYRTRVEKAVVGESAVNVFVAADISPTELPTGDSPHVFFFPDYQGIDQGDRETEGYFVRSPLEISIPCLNDPALAPAGKTGIIISALASRRYADNWGIADGMPDARYRATGERVTGQILENAEKLFPNLRQHVVFTQLSTPFTLERYTLNSGGSIIGWTYDRNRTFDRGSSVHMRRAVLTPVRNLLQAGHWTLYPGGAPMGVLSGRLAAERITKSSKGMPKVRP
jgi:phytoene dehydrogenase-like protein